MCVVCKFCHRFVFFFIQLKNLCIIPYLTELNTFHWNYLDNDRRFLDQKFIIPFGRTKSLFMADEKKNTFQIRRDNSKKKRPPNSSNIEFNLATASYIFTGTFYMIRDFSFFTNTWIIIIIETVIHILPTEEDENKKKILLMNENVVWINL